MSSKVTNVLLTGIVVPLSVVVDDDDNEVNAPAPGVDCPMEILLKADIVPPNEIGSRPNVIVLFVSAAFPMFENELLTPLIVLLVSV